MNLFDSGGRDAEQARPDGEEALAGVAVVGGLPLPRREPAAIAPIPDACPVGTTVFQPLLACATTEARQRNIGLGFVEVVPTFTSRCPRGCRAQVLPLAGREHVADAVDPHIVLGRIKGWECHQLTPVALFDQREPLWNAL